MIRTPSRHSPSLRTTFARTSALTVTAIVLAASTLAAHAAGASKAESIVGPYVGVGLGGSGLAVRDVDARKTKTDENDGAAKIYGGYQLTDTFGVEAGYVRLGEFKDRFRVNGSSVTQSASGRSFYVAGTGRLPLSDAFALTGKAGLSLGKVSGTNRLSDSDSPIGTKRSFMLGLGAEYRMSRDIALTVDLDSYGKLSDKVYGSALLLGVKYSF